jgi:Fas apoptotic inhibitory molecule (FAIM1)
MSSSFTHGPRGTIKRSSWSFLTASRKQLHHLVFEHNLLTGSQLLIVDGRVFYKASMQFKLTGSLCWHIEDNVRCELYIKPVNGGSSFMADALGAELSYTLTVDGKALTPVDEPVITAWRVEVTPPALQTTCVEKRPRATFSIVEFEHRELAVFVDGLQKECSVGFLDEELLAAVFSQEKDAAAADPSAVIPPSCSVSIEESCKIAARGSGAVLGSQHSFILPFKPSEAPSAEEGRACVLIVQPDARPGMLRATLIVDGKVMIAVDAESFLPPDVDIKIVETMAAALSPASALAGLSSEDGSARAPTSKRGFFSSLLRGGDRLQKNCAAPSTTCSAAEPSSSMLRFEVGKGFVRATKADEALPRVPTSS